MDGKVNLLEFLLSPPMFIDFGDLYNIAKLERQQREFCTCPKAPILVVSMYGSFAIMLKKAPQKKQRCNLSVEEETN